MNLFKKIGNKIKTTWYLLFFAMKGADNVIFGHQDNEGNTVLERHDTAGGVFHDLLEQKVTQEVEELRDKNYRVLRESDLYDASTIDMILDENGNISSFQNASRLAKKTLLDFVKHPPVYGEKPLVIQENRKYETNSTSTEIYNYDTLLEVGRDEIIPRFYIEKFVTKIVIRDHDNDKKKYVDLYVPSESSQFGKIDAMLIANIYRMWSEKEYRSDITDFSTLEFVSFKAWGVEDMMQFKFKTPKLIDIKVFDGSFVLVFDCDIEIYEKYLPEKFVTKELDVKYKNKEKKTNTLAIDVNNFKKKSFLQ